MDETLEKKAHLLKLKKEIDLLLEQLKQAILGTVLKDNVLDSAEPETKDFLIQFLRDKIVHTFYTLDKNTDKKPSDFNEFVNIIKHRIM
ncbi:MAG: hypothetical protein JSS53_10440, partial [Proteobacteria bacterium]|nr:hypothetical protein [Pseudomonadota bacterium]